MLRRPTEPAGPDVSRLDRSPAALALLLTSEFPCDLQGEQPVFHALSTRRMTAAVLVASLIGVGAAAAQSAPTVTITNSGSIPVSINIPSLKDYREDL